MSFLITFMEDKYKDQCQEPDCTEYMKVIIQNEGRTRGYCPEHFRDWTANKFAQEYLMQTIEEELINPSPSTQIYPKDKDG